MEIVPTLLLTIGVKTSSEACNYRQQKGQDTSCFEENADPKASVKEHDICESYSFALRWKEPPVQGFWMMDCVASSGRVGGVQVFQF